MLKGTEGRQRGRRETEREWTEMDREKGED